jgi:hypothetical protein
LCDILILLAMPAFTVYDLCYVQEIIAALHLEDLGGTQAPPLFKQLIVDLVSNVLRDSTKSCGNRWSTATKDLFAAAVIKGGPAVVEFITENLGGPSLSTIQAHRKKTKQVGQEFSKNIISDTVAEYIFICAAYSLQYLLLKWRLITTLTALCIIPDLSLTCFNFLCMLQVLEAGISEANFGLLQSFTILKTAKACDCRSVPSTFLWTRQ